MMMEKIINEQNKVIKLFGYVSVRIRGAGLKQMYVCMYVYNAGFRHRLLVLDLHLLKLGVSPSKCGS